MHRQLLCATAMVVATASPAFAQNAPKVAFDIPGGDAATALNAFSRQAGVQLLFPYDAITGRQVQGLKGSYTRAEALRRIIAGLPLAVAADDGRTVSLRQASAEGASAAAAGQAVEPPAADIVVTAQKRAEPLSRVPVAVTLLSGRLQEVSRAYDINGIKKLTPSVTLNVGGQGATGGFRIRGVGTDAYSPGNEPDVATFIDGVLVGRTESINGFNFFDIARTEILSGPQGTLFGKNASAGVVNVITKAPTDELHVDFDGLYAARNEYRIAGAISGPLTSNLSARIAFQKSGADGYIRNVGNQQAFWAPALAIQPTLLNGLKLNNQTDLGGYDSWGLRGKLRWNATPRLTLDLTLETDYARSSCCARTYISIDPNLLGGLNGAKIGPQSNETSEDANLSENDRQYAAILSAKYHLGGGFDLVSITGYRSGNHLTVQDQDYLSGPQSQGANNGNKSEWDIQPETSHQISQEVRLQSPVGKLIDFVAGAYYFHQRVGYDNGNRHIIQNQAVLKIPGCEGLTYCRRDFTYQESVTNDNYALFGQVNLHLTPALTLIGGGRYAVDDLAWSFTGVDYAKAPFRQGVPFLHLEGKPHASDFSGKLGAQYQLTKSIFTYFTYSQGYKGPGVNVPPAGTIEDVVKPEHVDAYEAGLKTSFFDKRLSINIAAFDSRFRDFVVGAFDTNSNRSRTFNAASVKSRGVEFSIYATPSRRLNLYAAGTFLDAKFESFPFDSCYANQQQIDPARCVFSTQYNRLIQDASGGILPKAPKFRGVIEADYTFPLGGLPFDGFVQGMYRHSSTEYYDTAQDIRARQNAYDVADASLGVTDRTGRYRITLFANNLFDKFYADTVFAPGASPNYSAGVPATQNQRIPRDYRRYVGVQVSTRF